MAFRYNDLNVNKDLIENENVGRAGDFFQFPLHNQERYVAKIQFQAMQLNSPTFGAKLAFVETAQAILEGRPVNRNDNTQSKTATITPLGKVDLYMPQAFSIRDAFDYQTPSLGGAGAVGLAAAQQGGNILDIVGKTMSEGFRGINDLIDGLGGAELGRLATVRAAQLIPGETGSNIASGATSASLNPNIRALFRSVGLREFAFQFKFIPNSQAETEQILQIIDFFRYHAYPEDIPVGGTISVGYKFPEMFRIKAFSRDESGAFIQTGSHIKDCFLRSISTTYNPTSAVYHKDGQPTEIDFALNFIEHKTLSKKDFNRYNVRVEAEPSVGGINLTQTNRNTA